MNILIDIQISELITVIFDLWMKLGCASWLSMVVSWWIALILTMRLSMSLVRSDVSRGRRENTLSTLYSHVTATTSCSSFLLAEVSLITTSSSKFSPKNRRIWYLSWWLMEVRHTMWVCEYECFADTCKCMCTFTCIVSAPVWSWDVVYNQSHGEEDWCSWPMVSSAHHEHYLVGSHNKFWSPQAHRTLLSDTMCARRLVWPRGSGGSNPRITPVLSERLIARSKELQSASQVTQDIPGWEWLSRPAPIQLRTWEGAEQNCLATLHRHSYVTNKLRLVMMCKCNKLKFCIGITHHKTSKQQKS